MTKQEKVAGARGGSREQKSKESLRKAAMARVKKHSGSLLDERSSHDTANSSSKLDSLETSRNPENQIARLKPSDINSEQNSSSMETQPDATSSSREESEQPYPELLPSPPISSADGAYVSTTEEELTTHFYQPSASSSISSLNLPLPGSSASLSRRRPLRSELPISPGEDQAIPDFELEDDWDYSETEWWGWIILIVTWLVFVVVMGSCFGVWSWAWDVGETPYAPPELEDDATLPITGYYPALIVCTAIMSWVWVVVAWVGMKYFRHAKMV